MAISRVAPLSLDPALQLENLSPTSRSLRVPFGLREKRLYEPMQVESGLQCGCTCPGCGARLVARHSPSGRVASNFAHNAGADCATGFETAVHLAAKQLIADRMKLFLPRVVARAPGIGISGKDLGRERLVSPAGVRSLNAVRVEEGLGPIRPDLLVFIGEQKVLVEIAVTHFVDEVKLSRIQALGIPAVEFDLSGLREMNFEALENALCSESPKAQWVWHPEREKERAQLQWLVDADLENDQAVWAEAEAFRLRKEAADKVVRQREEKDARLLAEKLRQAAREREIYARQRAAAFRDAPEHEKLHMVLQHLGAEEAQLLEFLPVTVAARRAVAAAPLVWQGAVFSGLIHRALSRGIAELTAEAVRAWVRERFEVSDDEETLRVAVWQYLDGLQKRGLLHHEGRQRFLIAVSGWSTARAVVADARQGGVVPLAWVREWPEGGVVTRLAEVFGKMNGAPEKWRRLAGLRSEVRGKDKPEDTVGYYAETGLEVSKVRRFFIAGGFVRLAGEQEQR